MAKGLIKAEILSTTIVNMLDGYKEDVCNNVYKAGHKAIKDLERRTVDTAPIGRRRKPGSHFRESIATKSSKDRIGNSSHLWYVKAPNYRLTHLLVHGHATRNGGRTKPNPFLVNALEPVLEQYEKDVEEAVKNG